MYYSDQVPANLLCYTRRCKKVVFLLSYDDELGTFTTVTPSGRTKETAEGLYLLCADPHGNNALGLAMTVDDNKEQF